MFDAGDVLLPNERRTLNDKEDVGCGRMISNYSSASLRRRRRSHDDDLRLLFSKKKKKEKRKKGTRCTGDYKGCRAESQ